MMMKQALSLVNLELAQKLLALRVNGGGFDRLLNKVRIVEVKDNGMVAEMRVEEEHCASPQRPFMHGAMVTLLVDSLSGVALMAAHPHFHNSGVSVNINMTYIQAAQLGHEILIKAVNDKVGSRLAFLSVDIIDKSNNKLLVQGSHTKFIEKAAATKSSST